MNLDQFTEPAGGWVATTTLILTLGCNNNMIIPAIRGIPNFTKTKDVYIGYIDFQDTFLPPSAN